MNVVDLEISTAVKTLDSLGRDHGPDNVTVLFQSFRVSSVDRAVLYLRYHRDGLFVTTV